MFDWLGKQGITQTLTSPIPADLWLRTVCHQIAALDRRGFRVAFLITGHYGGLEVDMRLLCEFYRRRTGTPMRLWAGADWELITFEDFGGDHAGVTETSQMLALSPELVDLSRAVEDSRTGAWAGHTFPTKDGVTPSADLGEKIVASQIERIGEIQRKFLEAYEPNGDYTPPNMDEVDDLWYRFERLTKKYWVLSLTYDEFVKGERVEFPGWEVLGL
jgi:creatinine amidohydrolase/Fe(II)-dependent formamide hydrolase-like protein